MGLLNGKKKETKSSGVMVSEVTVNDVASVDSVIEDDLEAQSQAFEDAKLKRQVETGEDIFADDPEGWETASKLIWKPRVGDVLIGMYDGNMIFTEGTFDAEVNVHFIKTKSGDRYSFVGGQVFDKALSEAPIFEGTQVRIKYLGQTLTKKDQRVNLFDLKYKK